MLTNLVIAALAATSAHAYSYIGCNNLFGLGISVPTFPKSTEKECLDTCKNRGEDYGFYQQSTNWCFCSVDSSASRAVVSPGNKNQCTEFRAYALRTTFDDVTCADNLARDARDSKLYKGSDLYLDSCYESCKHARYAIFRPRGAGFLGIDYECRCANYPPITSGGTTCGRNNYYIQSHTPGEAASGLARRAVQERAAAAQALLDANPYCPVGFKPCQVSPNSEDGYECLRTENELESCGGCVYGVYGTEGTNATGVDCSALPGVDRNSVSCQSGQCQVARCRRGFNLNNGACEARA